jgi:hypothetical protein
MAARPHKGKVKRISLWGWLALIVVISFCTGFLIGVTGHRDGKQIADFVSYYTSLDFSPDGSVMLVFRCGNSEKLVAYDLLSDGVLLDRDAIQSRRNNPLFKFTQTELFATAAGFAASSLGIAYSFTDELKLLAAGKGSWRRGALILTLAIPLYMRVTWLRIS